MSLVVALFTTLSAKYILLKVIFNLSSSSLNYGGHFVYVYVYVYDEINRLIKKISNLGEMVRKMTLVLDGSRLISTHLAQVVSPLS